ncbi:uncharacterized protein LOC114748721 [Neltuma alba]|uniref:uncharacterized protein LOC114748721 n=1 Tax=Neltuma alba TaxID=207710 RepID=UPI0010A5669A|nr:uncharacterized protein LOC114748721 [Prosopis alba]
MDSSSDHLLIFFLLFSYHNLNGLAMATSDESLISTLCSKTEEPVICRECVQADPSSKSANGQGLALIAIACAERDTTFLRRHSSFFRMQGHYDSAIKASVIYCLKLFERTPELPVPQQVLAGTVASNQTCRNAVEILSSI